MHRATLREVAVMAGVHPATASRALNQQTESLVNSATAARIKKIAAEMGYSPNPIARSLKTSRSASIGLVIPDLTNPLFPPIVRGIEDVLRPMGYNAWIVNTDSRPDVEKAAAGRRLRACHWTWRLGSGRETSTGCSCGDDGSTDGESRRS